MILVQLLAMLSRQPVFWAREKNALSGFLLIAHRARGVPLCRTALQGSHCCLVYTTVIGVSNGMYGGTITVALSLISLLLFRSTMETGGFNDSSGEDDVNDILCHE